MRILICDDEVHYSDAIRSSIDRWMAASGNSDIAVDVFCSSEDVLEALENKRLFDLAFLDIKFPGEMNGLQVAQALRALNEDMAIVFISNYEEYVTDGYRVNALRFFYKPITDRQIFECMDIAYSQWQMSLEDAPIIVENKGALYKLAPKTILYVEARAPYLSIHVIRSEKSVIQIRRKLTDLYLTLPSDIFIQCHQSFIINLLHVQRLSKSSIVLTDGTEIPISMRFKDNVYLRFRNAYFGGEK